MRGMSKMLAFLKELRENNDRLWFAERKDYYNAVRAECIDEIERILRRASAFDPDLRGVAATDCIYRIYRDIRFSADKRPLKEHFGIVMARGGRRNPNALYYLHIQPGCSGLYVGVHLPEPAMLKKLRIDIDAGIEEFDEIMSAPEFSVVFPGLVGESLKSMPKGFAKDLPHADVLKMKEFLVMTPLDDEFFADDSWLDTVVGYMKLAKPFKDFLNYSLE